MVSEYCGAGYVGELMQMVDDQDRQTAQEQRQAWQTTVDAEKLLDALLDEVTEAVNAYTGALMIATGHHQHKRQWRKKRGQRQG